jgi:1-deoxy-D-xylulose-5-phosphate synthase
VLDLALTLAIPGMTVFAPSSAQEVPVMLRSALELDGPAAIRYPKGPARQVDPASVGSGTSARKVRQGDGTVCLLAVGKMVKAAEEAADELAAEGIGATIWDARVVKPPDPAMLTDAAGHGVVVTVEDGIRVGGAGAFLVDAMAALDETRRIPPVLVLGIPVAYIPQGKPPQILSDLGLDGPGIAASVRNVLETSPAAAPLDLD